MASRAARRLQAKSGRVPLRSITDLLQRLRSVAEQVKGAEIARATNAVKAMVEARAQQGASLKTITDDLATGAAAFRAGAIDHQAHTTRDDSPLATAACKAGCAFCCILPGQDGGVVTRHEATVLHTALAPFAGQPDGRDWHPRACSALDPKTQSCRAYKARPLICRAYFSTDVSACKVAVTGEARAGTGVLGAYPLYLAVQALARVLLGVSRAPTYSLAKVASAAVEGQSLEAALKQAKHAPSVLAGERDRTDLI